jgi:tetratricopeptide (TPR) repeat protein
MKANRRKAKAHGPPRPERADAGPRMGIWGWGMAVGGTVVVLGGGLFLATRPGEQPRVPEGGPPALGRAAEPTSGVGPLVFEARAPGPPASLGTQSALAPATKADGMDAPVDDPESEVSDLTNKGNERVSQGRIEEGIALLEQALKLNPDDEEAHFNLGYALARKGDLAGAVERYKKALELLPDYVEAHNNLGNVYRRMERYGEAIEQFNAALKLMPENASTLNNLGRALGEQGKTAEAITNFMEAVKADPDFPEARFNLANSLLAQGRVIEATAHLDELVRRHPDFQPAQAALARLRERR